MIIELLLNFIYNLMDTILFIEIGTLPADAHTYIDSAFEYMAAGCGILAVYTPLSYILGLLSFVIFAELGIYAYRFVMWVLAKIPMLNIK